MLNAFSCFDVLDYAWRLDDRIVFNKWSHINDICNPISCEVNVRKMSLACLWALLTISSTCAVGDRLSLTRIPKSWVCSITFSSWLLINRWGADSCILRFNTQHLSLDIPSCHSWAQSVKVVSACCKCPMSTSTSFTIVTYYFTSSANIFTFIWYQILCAHFSRCSYCYIHPWWNMWANAWILLQHL